MKIMRLAHGVDVMSVLLDLARSPWLWDQNKTRREYAGTPHSAMTDIWVRFRPQREIVGIESHNEEYRCEFWPAWYQLPALRGHIFALMTRVQAVELGSILITRLPPGAMIDPHSDAGSWAPEHYNTKCHLMLAGQSVVTCGEEQACWSAGEVWTFDNLLRHSIHNPGQVDRIVVIVSMRVKP